MSPNRRARKRKLSKQSTGNSGSSKRLKGRTLQSVYNSFMDIDHVYSRSPFLAPTFEF